MRLSPTKPRRAKFISVFLISAVSHARRYIDQTTRLKVEFELNGSKGYILNYVVIIRGILISITEARWNEAESAIAQNRIQIYSAAEVRFLDQWDLDLSFLTTSMGLIILSSEIIRQTKTWTNRSRNVTTSSGYVWHRINRPWVAFHPLEWYVGITESWYNWRIFCDFSDNNMKTAKKVIDYIARILQAQARQKIRCETFMH